jgi:hypothetical protein
MIDTVKMIAYRSETVMVHIPGDCDRHSDAIATAVPI